MGMRKWFSKRDEDDLKSRDWAVLSAVLIGTGLAVLATAPEEVHAGLRPLDPELTGQIVLTMYAAQHTFCDGGLSAVQAQEDLRAATSIARGNTPHAVDVVAWIASHHADQSDNDLVAQYGAHLLETDMKGPWTRNTTLAFAIECEMVRRGLV